jgi:hypothetical protein
MAKTLVQTYANSVIGGMLGQAASLSSLDHRLLKGELRELFVSALLGSFLTAQFGVGSGVVVNQAGDQSRQTDVIIYDNRILPPFVREQHLGVYPAEGVLATIEVKSWLRATELTKAENSASQLIERVYRPDGSRYHDLGEFVPLLAVIGFNGTGARGLGTQDKGRLWLRKNVEALQFVCLVDRYSWIHIEDEGWIPETNDRCPGSHNETVAFLAVLLDNLRTQSEKRLALLGPHRDWLSLYLRDQGLFSV